MRIFYFIIISFLIFSGCQNNSKYNTPEIDTIEDGNNSFDSGSISLNGGNSSNTNDTLSSISNEKAKQLYTRCTPCHGKNGQINALQKSRIIGGEDRETLLYELEEYKAGRLNQYGLGQIMKGQLQNLNHNDLKILAYYISTLSGEE